MADLKPVYKAETNVISWPEIALDALEEKWIGTKYPIVIKSWLRKKWPNLSVYFKYRAADIRRVIYTTNAIEAVHRQFRKLTKTKGAFPNENSLAQTAVYGDPERFKKMDHDHCKTGI